MWENLTTHESAVEPGLVEAAAESSPIEHGNIDQVLELLADEDDYIVLGYN